MTTEWPPWDRGVDPAALARYLSLGAAPKMVAADLAVRLPGPGQGQPLARARASFDFLSRVGIAYVHEPPGHRGVQLIRPLDQVLAQPRHGTCLDLCVAYASVCFDADVRTILVVLDSNTGGAGHALALVWLDGGIADGGVAYPFDEAVFTGPPVSIDDVPLSHELARDARGSGAFLAVDVTVAATDPLAASDPDTAWRRAVERGTELVEDAIGAAQAWRWSLGVDVVGARSAPGYTQYRSNDWRFERDPLVRPFFDDVRSDSPATVIGARQRSIEFAPREEYDRLLDWATATDGATSSPVRLAVVHGVGGSGKTRLAAEVARRLSDDGWYAGFFATHPAPRSEELEWLQGVVSPTLAVIDYAEQFSVKKLTRIVTALAQRDSAGRVVLTARSLGQWWPELTRALARKGLLGDRLDLLSIGLPRHHPDPSGMLGAALRSFGLDPSSSPGVDGTWTTLDMVMYAWLASTDDGRLPDPGEAVGGLRDALIERELAYWRSVCVKRGLPEYPDWLLARIGACVTLRAPRDVRRCEAALAVLPEFESPSAERSTLAHQITALLTSDRPADGLALRPDPVGERLVIRELSADPALFDRALPDEIEAPGPDEEATDLQLEGLNALRVVTVAEGNGSAAQDLARRVVEQRPGAARAAAVIAYRFGGPLVSSLLDALRARRCPPDLVAELADVPRRSAVFRTIAWEATLQLRPEHAELVDTEEQAARLRERSDGAELAREARWLDQLAGRAYDMGYVRYGIRAHGAAAARYAHLAAIGTDAAANRLRFAESIHTAAYWAMDTGDEASMRSLAQEAFDEWHDGLGDDGATIDDLRAVRVLVTHSELLVQTDPDRARMIAEQLLVSSEEIREMGFDGYVAVADLHLVLAHCALNRILGAEADGAEKPKHLAAAEDAADEAVRLNSMLFDLDPGSSLTGLCRAKMISAFVAAVCGRENDCRHAIRDVVQLYRDVARWGGPGIESGLSHLLRGAAHARALLGDLEGAVSTALDAVRILERLRSEDDTGSFRRLYAESLAECAYFQRGADDAASAAALDERALVEWDEMVREDFPDAFPRYLEVMRSAVNIDTELGRAPSVERRVVELSDLGGTRVLAPPYEDGIRMFRLYVDAVEHARRSLLAGGVSTP